jgi:pimeloyl-ACP methyl ester carboxylesterase
MPVNSDSEPILLIPGLNCSARMYAPQLPALWQLGPVTIADHRRGESMVEIAGRILAAAPARFRLGGFSMGGYLALEIMRQQPARATKLALIDTSARPEAPAQTERRTKLIALAAAGRFPREVNDVLWPLMVDPSRQSDVALRSEIDRMAEETGADVFARQQRAVMGRADSRSLLASIAFPTLVIVGETDQLTPSSHAEEMAKNIADARLERLAGCGHMSTMEKPGEVTQLLVKFFA